MIETLPLLTPDARIAERTRARCHQRLARQRRHRETAEGRAKLRYLAAERMVICGLCVVYISGVAFVVYQMLAGR